MPSLVFGVLSAAFTAEWQRQYLQHSFRFVGALTHTPGVVEDLMMPKRKAKSPPRDTANATVAEHRKEESLVSLLCMVFFAVNTQCGHYLGGRPHC